MLVSLSSVLQKAQKGRYAVGAFNVNNMEICQAALAAALKLRAPVILQTSEGAIEYAGMEYLTAIIKIAAQSPIPVVMHLDHGKNLDTIREAIAAGYTSVMYDGSSLSLQENIKNTKQVVAWAKRKKVSVEAELGAISGIEDFVSVAQQDAHLTNPQEAVEFVRKTGCDALAVAIGTAHGIVKFKKEPHLDLARLREIRRLVKVPLVLHGASEVDQRMVSIAKKYGATFQNAYGVPDTLLKKAVHLGITKVNTDTDLRLAFDAGVREVVATKPEAYDPRALLAVARTYMEQVAAERIIVLGSKNKGKI